MRWTQNHGRILVLVISRSSENMVVNSYVTDGISDHSAVFCFLHVHRQTRLGKKIKVLRIKFIDSHSMTEDVVCLPLFTSHTGNADGGLLSQYNSGVAFAWAHIHLLLTKTDSSSGQPLNYGRDPLCKKADETSWEEHDRPGWRSTSKFLGLLELTWDMLLIYLRPHFSTIK